MYAATSGRRYPVSRCPVVPPDAKSSPELFSTTLVAKKNGTTGQRSLGQRQGRDCPDFVPFQDLAQGRDRSGQPMADPLSSPALRGVGEGAGSAVGVVGFNVEVRS